jgi:hypothetical protein
LKEEDLDRTMWRARFGRGFGRVVRQTTKLNEQEFMCLGTIYVYVYNVHVPPSIATSSLTCV